MIGFRDVPCEPFELASIGVAGSKCVEIYSEDFRTLVREPGFKGFSHDGCGP